MPENILRPDDNVVTVRELYTLLDKRMEEVKSIVERVETKVDILGEGRVASLERDFTGFKATVTTKSRNQAAVLAVVITFAGNFFFVILNYFLK